jgi:pimeloyl-ACP methyl ester carboxylesterase
VTIEGNLAPEDCGVFSRAAASVVGDSSEGRFLRRLQAELEGSTVPGDDVFAGGFLGNVSRRMFFDVCRSIVRICDTRPLLDAFLGLGVPRMFVPGAASPVPTYLERLRACGVDIVTVLGSGHFPLYANPRLVSQALSVFLDRVEGGCRRAESRGGTA